MAVTTMPDGNEAMPVDLPAALAMYAAAHAGATAAIEYLGKKGAQIVVTAGDDAEELVLAAASVDAAREACAVAGIAVDNGWERELTELARPSHDLWRARTRRSLTR